MTRREIFWRRGEQIRLRIQPRFSPRILVLLIFLLFVVENRFCRLSHAQGPAIQTARELWNGYDPRAEPLEIEIARTWDEESVRFEQLSFTGETWEGTKVRVFAYRGAPREGKSLPGILHLHGGGQTASLDWVRFWAKRGYVAVSHDFCGSGAGRPPDKVTQWGRAPAFMADPAGPKSSLHPSARFNSWYHWILVARRALSLLEQHPQVDPKRLGVFGISVGGTLTWMVAGIDDRVAIAVPIYGVGQNTYTFPWQSPDDPVDDDTLLTRAVIEPEGYAPLVTCPLLFMNASNDHHGRLDLGMRTLNLATHSRMLREIYSPRDIHQIEPAEAGDLPLWMDFHLKGIGPDWPESPVIHANGSNSTPRITVKVDRPAEVESVTIYYGLNNPWPSSRFYRTVIPGTVSGKEYTGSTPFQSADDIIYTFANVSYRSGIHMSTRLIKIASADLPGAGASLQRTDLIDPMDDHCAWFWWLAGTDPLDPAPLFQPWRGPQGECGFTHASAAGFSFATNALGDPQFRGHGTQTLLVDLWAKTLPRSLVVGVATRFFQPGQVKYTTEPSLEKPEGDWLTLRFSPSDFKTDTGTPLSGWDDVDFLHFQGASDGESRTVFKNLRWEKID